MAIIQPNAQPNPFTSLARAALPSFAPILDTVTRFNAPETPYPTAPAPQTGAGAIPQTGVPATLFSVFSSAGFTPTAIYGILGNVQQESGFNPQAWNAREGASGLFQHRLERLTQGQAYTQQKGLNWNDPTGRAQALWAVEEINRNPALKAKLNAAQTPEEAATIFDREFERSTGMHTAARQQFARKWAGGTPAPYSIPQEMAQHPEGLLPTTGSHQGGIIDQQTMDRVNAMVAQIQGSQPDPQTKRRRKAMISQYTTAQVAPRRSIPNAGAPGDTFDPALGDSLIARARSRGQQRRTGDRSLPRVQIPGRN